MNARELPLYYFGLACWYRGQNGEPKPDRQDIRDLRRQLDAARTVDTPEGLADLKPDTVIRDGEGYVVERLPGGWYWGDAPFTPALPVRVLALPGEA